MLPTENSSPECYNLPDMLQRIRCRLQETSDQVAKEQAEHYLPEECQALADGSIERSDCVARYTSIQPCWSQPIGPQRIACVQNALNIDALEPVQQYCQNQDSTCTDTYKKKIYHLITFRFYDLEERVEGWYRDGKLSLDDAVNFVAFIVNSKIQFSAATTKSQHIAVIDSVESRWQNILSTLK